MPVLSILSTQYPVIKSNEAHSTDAFSHLQIIKPCSDNKSVMMGTTLSANLGRAGKGSPINELVLMISPISWLFASLSLNFIEYALEWTHCKIKYRRIIIMLNRNNGPPLISMTCALCEGSIWSGDRLNFGSHMLQAFHVQGWMNAVYQLMSLACLQPYISMAMLRRGRQMLMRQMSLS